jgi:hypothetical protein
MYKGAYTAQGLWGQFVTVIPELDVVVAVETPQKAEPRFGLHSYIMLLDTLINARCSAAPCP